MSSFFESFHFLRPLWFLALPVGIVVWRIWSQRFEPFRGWRSQMDAELLSAVTGRQQRQRRWFGISMLGVWMVSTFALAGPTWRKEPSPFANDAAPLMVLLKANSSMATPAGTATLLERAQMKIQDLASERAGQPLGLIAYSGSAHLVLPPTQDTQIVAEMASNIAPEIMPVDGDRLDEAIKQASELLTANQQGGTLLVIADSITTQSDQLSRSWTDAGRYPVQCLIVAPSAANDQDALRKSVEPFRGTVRVMTPDDEDIGAIVRAAERGAAASLAGESDRWEEAGYWLTPLVALMFLVSLHNRKQLA